MKNLHEIPRKGKARDYEKGKKTFVCLSLALLFLVKPEEEETEEEELRRDTGS